MWPEFVERIFTELGPGRVAPELLHVEHLAFL